MSLTRRSFFRRTLGAIAAAAVAPFIPSPPIQLFGGEPVPIVGQIRYMMNVVVLSPRLQKQITNITN